MSIDDPACRIDMSRLPEHIAIIMDGNGRWAQNRGLTRIEGHRAGVQTVNKVVTFCRKIGVKSLTLYSFSSENWKRPPGEVAALMGILKEFLTKELGRMQKENIRFNTIGRIDDLPLIAREAVRHAISKTRTNSGMTLTLALSYGSRAEIVGAVRAIAKDVANGIVKPEEIGEDEINSYLDTSALPDPDLLIRTSGELRVSNFLLWQIAYTELYFSKKLWPDFTEADITEAIASYQGRERRYGMTASQLNTAKE